MRLAPCKRRPDVAFVSYARWPTSIVAREPAWNVVPDLAIEILSPTNLAEEIDRKMTDYFRQRFAWSGSFIRILAGSMSISRRDTSAFWNAPTPWMAARYCPAFGYPLPNCMKPWPNQNKPSATPGTGAVACLRSSLLHLTQRTALTF